jgi:mono/diheme cytochrome c family protein
MDMKHIAIIGFCAALIGCGAASQGQSDQKEPTAAEMFNVKCALCHGKDGKLNVAGAPDLTKTKMSLDERIEIITNGKGTMPPQGEILTEAQIVTLAEYVETLKH